MAVFSKGKPCLIRTETGNADGRWILKHKPPPMTTAGFSNLPKLMTVCLTGG